MSRGKDTYRSKMRKQNTGHLSLSVWAVKIKCHQLGDIENNKPVKSLQAAKSKIKVPADSMMVIISTYPHTVEGEESF